MQKIVSRIRGAKVHISFDIDALDPAFAPGTEIPSSGGMSTREALDLLRAATEHSEIVGIDVVEVSPPFDNGDITIFAALKLIFEVWGMALILSRSAGDISEGHGNR
jgi:agmatinase